MADLFFWQFALLNYASCHLLPARELSADMTRYLTKHEILKGQGKAAQCAVACAATLN
jgi:hypothetical protein